MSEKMEAPVTGGENGGEEYIEKIRYTDPKTGIVHEFKSTTELMQWQEEANADRNNP